MSGPKLVEITSERIETVKCPECNHRFRKTRDRCLFCEYLSDKDGVLHQLESEEMKSSPQSIRSVLEDVKTKKEISLEENGMTVVLQSDSHEVMGGEYLLEVFLILIENALVHSSGSQININVKEFSSIVVVSVLDDGQGIPDDQKTRIFYKGYTNNERSGEGLGLFIAKQIIDAYGGNLTVSESENGGARFDIFLQKPNKYNDG